MLDQDLGPPNEEAAGEVTDGQDIFTTTVKKKEGPEECIETTEKASFSIARHERVAKVLKGALASDQTVLWHGFIRILTACLTLPERTALAFAALRALPDTEREATCLAAHPCAGMPITPLFTYMSEAELWAELATKGELDAYTLAGFRAMTPSRRTAFLKYVHQGVADGT